MGKARNEYVKLGVQTPQRMVNDILNSGEFTQMRLAFALNVSQATISRLKRYDHGGDITYLVGKRLERLWQPLKNRSSARR